MKHQKRFLLIAVATALAIFTLGCSFNFSTAKITDAIMTDSIDADGKPGSAVSVYPADTETLYTSAIIKNAPDNTIIRIEWINSTTGKTINLVSFDSGDISDRYIYSSLKPDRLLTVGDYEVRYFIDGRTEPDATVKFMVAASEAEDAVAKNEEAVTAADDPSQTYLEDVHMTSGFDADGVPLDTIETLASTGTWYVSAILRNATQDTMIRFVWYDTEGSVIDDYDFDPQGETDVYIGGSMQLTNTAPDGQYWVELYIDNAEDPAAQVAFTVGEVSAAAAVDTGSFVTYSQQEGGFSIQYPADWEMIEMAESTSAAFYPEAYVIDGEDEVNAVVVFALKDYTEGYTLAEFQQAWINGTEENAYENYALVASAITKVNGRDIASYEYSWSRDGYNLYTMDFILFNGADAFVISYSATMEDVDTLYPYVEAMVLSFDVL